LKKIVEWLKLPETRNIEDPDAVSTTVLHGQIIQKKGFLKRIYIDFYKQLLKPSRQSDGLIVELESGGGFLKTNSNVITSDVLLVKGIDVCFSALSMPFSNKSISTFVMIDVLHHLSDVRSFFKEAERCLKIGGRCVMIEPANTLWSRFVYQNFHREGFYPDGDWDAKGDRPLSDANIAIPWIIFCRDRERFEREFPGLTIVKLSFGAPFRYLLSGGLSMKSLVPSFLYDVVKGIEFILSPFNKYLGMFMRVELEKL
jgi:SAM-dependent methyltransferase